MMQPWCFQGKDLFTRVFPGRVMKAEAHGWWQHMMLSWLGCEGRNQKRQRAGDAVVGLWQAVPFPR